MKLKNEQSSSNATNVLDRYAVNINDQVLKNLIDPIIGRDEEIRRVVRILARKNKNNPVLIGDPGVGKTAVVEGLAQRIVKNDVPYTLQNKIIYALDMSSLLAGASLQGEFERRLKSVIDYIKKRKNDIILFIDELHTIIGAGRTQGALDAANILKPVLARGDVRCIGATTVNEHREYINKDLALERRFQQVFIKEPTVEDTITILRGIKKAYDTFHGVTIHDDALVAAAKLSNVYISNRFLPDKAIDLVDEACSSVKTAIASSPLELEELRHQIINLEIEKAALSSDKDKNVKKAARLTALKQSLDKLKAQEAEFDKKWQKEKALWDQQKELLKRQQKLQRLHENAWQAGKYDIAGEIQYSKLPEIKANLKDVAQKLKKNKILKDDVTANEIANIVALWTSIPVTKLLETEKDKLLHLGTDLKKLVVGQDKAVQQVTNAVIRARSGIKDENRPIGAFLFLGPTGVGKTEVAKCLADKLFGQVKNLIRIDMSEYSEKHSIARLIGSPPGYIGFERGGQLTEAVLRQPYSVILLDEIEKAAFDVINLLLQLLDEGRLTDGMGRTVNFKNCLIIMTSNLGSKDILLGHDNAAITAAKNFFVPEFINRLDEIIVFNKLKKPSVFLIIDKFLNEINAQLNDKNVFLSLTDNAKEQIFAEGFSDAYGAREIKHYMEREIKTLLAYKILKDEVKNNCNYEIDCVFNQFKIKNVPAKKLS